MPTGPKGGDGKGRTSQRMNVTGAKRERKSDMQFKIVRVADGKYKPKKKIHDCTICRKGIIGYKVKVTHDVNNIEYLHADCVLREYFNSKNPSIWKRLFGSLR